MLRRLLFNIYGIFTDECASKVVIIESRKREKHIMGFSKDFLWGGATAANQYEGGVFEGGAGLATADVMTNGLIQFAVR